MRPHVAGTPDTVDQVLDAVAVWKKEGIFLRVKSTSSPVLQAR